MDIQESYKDIGISRVGRVYCQFIDNEPQPNIIVLLPASGNETGEKQFHVIEESPFEIGKYNLLTQSQIQEKYLIKLDEDTDDKEILKHLLNYDFKNDTDVVSLSSSYFTKVLHVNEEDLMQILLKVTNQAIDVDYFYKSVNFVNLMSKKFGLIILRKN